MCVLLAYSDPDFTVATPITFLSRVLILKCSRFKLWVILTSYITSKDGDCCTAASCSLAVLCDHLLDESAQKLLRFSKYVNTSVHFTLLYMVSAWPLPIKGNVKVAMILGASVLSLATWRNSFVRARPYTSLLDLTNARLCFSSVFKCYRRVSLAAY